MPGKLGWKQSQMTWWWEQCGYDVNSHYLSANRIILIYPSQHWTIHWSDFTRRPEPFKIRKCQSLRRPKWMFYWQENPISDENKRFIKFVLQWTFSYTGIKRLLHQNEGSFRCAWIEPDKRQPSGQVLIGRGLLTDLSAKSIRRYLLNASFSIYYSNIICVNYWMKAGLIQPVPEACLAKNFLKWRLEHNKRLTRQQKQLLTSVGIFGSVYPKLRLKPPPSESLTRTALWICRRERCMVSLWTTRCSSWTYSPYAWLRLKLGGRQLAFRSSGKPSNSV